MMYNVNDIGLSSSLLLLTNNNKDDDNTISYVVL